MNDDHYTLEETRRLSAGEAIEELRRMTKERSGGCGASPPHLDDPRSVASVYTNVKREYLREGKSGNAYIGAEVTLDHLLLDMCYPGRIRDVFKWRRMPHWLRTAEHFSYAYCERVAWEVCKMHNADFYEVYKMPVVYAKQTTVVYNPTEVININEEKDNTMHPDHRATQAVNAPMIERVTLYRGRDVRGMSESEIIHAIEQLDAEQDRIEPLKARSKAIAARFEKINDARTALIEELDSRPTE